MAADMETVIFTFENTDYTIRGCHIQRIDGDHYMLETSDMEEIIKVLGKNVWENGRLPRFEVKWPGHHYMVYIPNEGLEKDFVANTKNAAIRLTCVET